MFLLRPQFPLLLRRGLTALPTTTARASSRFYKPRYFSSRLLESSDSILQQLDGTGSETSGEVVYAKDHIVRVSDLGAASVGSIVALQNGLRGLVLNLEPNVVGLSLLSTPKTQISVGTKAELLPNERLTVRVPPDMCGIMFDGLGQISDSKTTPTEGINKTLETVDPPGVTERMPVSTVMYSGCGFIDLLSPIGRGQRIAFVGPRKSGKRDLALKIINAQRTANRAAKSDVDVVVCMYVMLSQSPPAIEKIKRILDIPESKDTVLVASAVTDSITSQYMAPITAVRLATHLRDQGRHVLMVFDEFGAHSAAAKDVFGPLHRPSPVNSLYATLLDHAANMKAGGSLTAISIVDNEMVDQSTAQALSELAAEAVKANSDHILAFDAQLMRKGISPAVDFLSQLYISSSYTSPLLREVSRGLKVQLRRYRLGQNRQQDLANLGLEIEEWEIEDSHNGEIAELLLRNETDTPVNHLIVARAVSVLALEDVLPNRNSAKIFKQELLSYFTSNHADLYSQLCAELSVGASKRQPSATSQLLLQLDDALEHFESTWV
eukprot:GILK01002741.1.p1 GENE.GILK01002741.1~~GILK01002741.1.p1  ORF type:complete len:551 (-),score=103.86 GILK01002741.1:120-1772(-)